MSCACEEKVAEALREAFKATSHIGGLFPCRTYAIIRTSDEIRIGVLYDKALSLSPSWTASKLILRPRV